MDPPKPNFNRMLRLIDEVFAIRNDPDQIQVNPKQLKKLEAIHPATLSELADENGPLIWALLIPTTKTLMLEFLSGKISEKTLLEKTGTGVSYDCIYLCSVTTLPEARGKGKTKQLCIDAIRAITKDHPVTSLFVWPFTKEGEQLAITLAETCGLQLFKKQTPDQI